MFCCFLLPSTLVFFKANTDHDNILMKYFEMARENTGILQPNSQKIKFTITTEHAGYTTCFWCGLCCWPTIFIVFWVFVSSSYVLCSLCCQYLWIVHSCWFFWYYYKHTSKIIPFSISGFFNSVLSSEINNKKKLLSEAHINFLLYWINLDSGLLL